MVSERNGRYFVFVTEGHDRVSSMYSEHCPPGARDPDSLDKTACIFQSQSTAPAATLHPLSIAHMFYLYRSLQLVTLRRLPNDSARILFLGRLGTRLCGA